MHQLEYNRRTKPTPHKLRYNPQFWGRMGGQPKLFMPMFGPGRENGVNDYSGNANDGTINGTIARKTTAYGAALKGDGSTGSVTTAQMSITGPPLTLWSWVIPTDISGIHSLLYYGSNLQEWGILINAGAVWALTQAGGLNNQATGGTVTVNNLYMVAGVFASASSRAVYLNGVRVGTNTTATTPSVVSPAANIFSRWSVSNQIFSGYTLASGIIPAALSDAQIAKLYQRPWAMFMRRRHRAVQATSGLLLLRRRAAAA